MNFRMTFFRRTFLAVWMTVGCCAVAGQPIGKKPASSNGGAPVNTVGETTTSEPPPELVPKR